MGVLTTRHIVVGAIVAWLGCIGASAMGSEDNQTPKDPKAIVKRAVELADSIPHAFEKDAVFLTASGAMTLLSDMGEAHRLAERISQESLRSHARSAMVDAQLKAGSIHEALATARVLPDGVSKDHTLARIFGAQIAAGDRPGALKTYARIHDKWMKFMAWSVALGPEPAEEMVRTAIGTANTVKDGRERSLALAAIVPAQVYARDIATALTTIHRIDDNEAKTLASWGLVAAQAKRGDPDGALKRSQGLAPQKELMAQAITEIAKALIRRGDLTGANKAASLLEDEDDRACVQRVMARAQARTGDLEGAIKIANSIRDTRQRHLAQLAIVVEQALGGHVELAVQKTLSFEDQLLRRFAIAEIALLQARRGDYKEAQDTFGKVSQPEGADLMFWSDMAKIQAARGDVTEALALAGAQNEPFRKAHTLLAVVAGMLREPEEPRFWEQDSCGKFVYRENIFYYDPTRS